MKVTPETVAAVNAWLSEIPIPLFDKYGTEIGTRSCDVKINAADVSALLLALSKCEPVRGLVGKVKHTADHIREGIEENAFDPAERFVLEGIADGLAAALAPFAEVE